MRRPAAILGALGLVGLAALLRIRVFHSFAAAWDPCEYAHAVRDLYLPHSPYVLYLWLGLLLAPLFGPELGLSLLSFAGGLLATVLLGRLVALDAGRAAAGWSAALLYAVFPVAVWFSGQQEVYAPHTSLLLGALLAARRGHPALGGGLFGAAIAMHTGAFFLLPAFGLALLSDPGGERRGARVRTAALHAALLPAASALWLLWLFEGRGEPASAWLGYLRGIAPAPGGASPLGLVVNLGLHGSGVAGVTLGSALPTLVLAAASLATLAIVGRQREAALWLVFALPFSVYEGWLGRRVDPGAYMVYSAPALAALIGLGVDALAARLRLPRWALAAAALAVALPPGLQSWALGSGARTHADFLADPEVRGALWIRDHTAAQTWVVVPSASQNRNLLPYLSRRRFFMPVKGRWQRFEGGRWAPLNPDSFRPVSPALIDQTLAEGASIVALAPEATLSAGTAHEWRVRRVQDGERRLEIWHLGRAP